MDCDKELLMLCSEICKSSGQKRFANKLDAYLQSQSSKHLEEAIEEGMNFIEFAKNSKGRSFSFGTGYTMNKYLIVTAEARYNDNGEAIIAVNEIPDESASFDKNPIKNLFIVYDNEEARDKDYEKVQFIMK